ncbi:MAG: HEAT repeat domain-containing protein [Candidatus Competibacter sp.]
MTAFEKMVERGWSEAVRSAVEDYALMKQSVISALTSSHPDTRSAAVAVFIEAGDKNVHDIVAALLDDPSSQVRDEAMEYLMDHALPEDAPRLIAIMRNGGNPFLATMALCRSTGKEGDIVDDDIPGPERMRAIERWENLVRRPPTDVDHDT